MLILEFGKHNLPVRVDFYNGRVNDTVVLSNTIEIIKKVMKLFLKHL